ncbi:xylulose 5-phosphate 3-epimerase [Pseudoxanthomonas sacheonensis]|uniref:xylulose 5-phosphate 3-epimerase n=1 Tax=Pseudoxanthomonas sacheonensis TaxID=443615 RepID=UPI0013D33EEA|nr:xylulose 5-phosphate 3-epimerase [Pseudoxanthomonas sacheonensis]KAF1710724.1 xylulose 5-phosphate 3-epimerase [Pseudoxanthomonas sacheonensis]
MICEEIPEEGLLAYGICSELDPPTRRRVETLAAGYCAADPAFAQWAAGYGVIIHDPLTQTRIHALAKALVAEGSVPDATTAYRRLAAADRLASAALWLVTHMTYARQVRLDGSELAAGDFKPHPEGHTGGSLNMVPAYAAYLALNALTGHTRSWLMGQGHCVAAVDAVNLLVGNMGPAHAERYGLDDARLSRFVSDFYSYAVGADGHPESPLGSHVNAHTAGSLQEGGYLGFAELHYAHAPLPGERLVAFLSDGAFEEQRGSDWAPRWWRPEDCGIVAPVMILNGRRIEQRTQIAQQGGERWLYAHLQLNGFQPLGIDGRDPASFVWGIHAIELGQRARLDAYRAAGSDSGMPLRYGVAQAPKGYGLPGAGSNRAHNLPLAGNPASNEAARNEFNTACRRLHVPETELREALSLLATHDAQRRPLERDHALAVRQVPLPKLPEPDWRTPGETIAPMAALDEYFVATIAANPALRPRVGNPDELRSNRLDHTLDRLKHRVQEPEPGVAEARDGAVITALNEEAVVCAALANKGGINLVVTYEAFAVKMLGALRQELVFARQLRRAGRAPGWLSMPLVLTSHTWENAKNEQSHQDPTLTEALLGEMQDGVSVIFPPDANAAQAALRAVYGQHGRIAALVVPKRELPVVLDAGQAAALARDGALFLAYSPDAAIDLVATGAYQLAAVRRAWERLREHNVVANLIYLGEPGRFRTPRDGAESEHIHDDETLRRWFMPAQPRLFVTHMRPEPFLGALRRLDDGPRLTRALGYSNRGGTLDVDGLMFANRCTWAHAVEAAAKLMEQPPAAWLSSAEYEAVAGYGLPAVLWQKEPA